MTIASVARKLEVVRRVFGPDRQNAALPVTPLVLTESRERWSCRTQGHVFVLGDEGCAYCSEAD